LRNRIWREGEGRKGQIPEITRETEKGIQKNREEEKEKNRKGRKGDLSTIYKENFRGGRRKFGPHCT